MPDDFRISELPSSASFNNGDLIEVSQVDAQSDSGYTSVKKQMTEVGDMINNGIEYTSGLNTTSKKVIGAINEVNSNIPVNSDFSLSGLSDTTINNPSSGQMLSYDGGKWKNIEPTAITPSYIHPSITNDNLLMFHKIGKTLIISGVFRGSDVPRYQTLYTLPNVKAVDSFIPFVQYGGGVGYLAVSKSGNNTNIMIANSSLTAFDNYNATNGTIILE